jgi:molecular chaperone GrpE
MKQTKKKDQEPSLTQPSEEHLEESSAQDAEVDETVESLKAQLEAKEKEVADNYNNYLRALADLENYKKRAAKEKSDLIKYGNENLLRDFLPILDSLDRALGTANNSNDFNAFREGLTLVRDQFLCCMEKYGVEPIAACGEDFDPNVHEAMLEVESDEHEERKVVDEFERGYLLQGRLLRPSKVSVCKRKEKS